MPYASNVNGRHASGYKHQTWSPTDWALLVTSQALRVDPSPTSSNVHAAASEYPLTPFQLLAPITGCVFFDVESLSLAFFSARRRTVNLVSCTAGSIATLGIGSSGSVRSGARHGLQILLFFSNDCLPDHPCLLAWSEPNDPPSPRRHSPPVEILLR